MHIFQNDCGGIIRLCPCRSPCQSALNCGHFFSRQPFAVNRLGVDSRARGSHQRRLARAQPAADQGQSAKGRRALQTKAQMVLQTVGGLLHSHHGVERGRGRLQSAPIKGKSGRAGMRNRRGNRFRQPFAAPDCRLGSLPGHAAQRSAQSQHRPVAHQLRAGDGAGELGPVAGKGGEAAAREEGEGEGAAVGVGSGAGKFRSEGEVDDCVGEELERGHGDGGERGEAGREGGVGEGAEEETRRGERGREERREMRDREEERRGGRERGGEEGERGGREEDGVGRGEVVERREARGDQASDRGERGGGGGGGGGALFGGDDEAGVGGEAGAGERVVVGVAEREDAEEGVLVGAEEEGEGLVEGEGVELGEDGGLEEERR